MFEQRIWPVTQGVTLKGRLLRDAGHARGPPFSQPHLSLAATGPQHGPTVVSRETAEHRVACAPAERCAGPWTGRNDAHVNDLKILIIMALPTGFEPVLQP